MAGRIIKSKKRIGVLGLQGGIDPHLQMLHQIENVETILARTPNDIQSLDGLIIPGGESTTIGKLMTRFGLDEAIKQKAQQGMGVFGTCAGMILMAKELENEMHGQTTLGLMDVTVRRNAFGSQTDSFECDLDVQLGQTETMHAVFIRAPVMVANNSNVKILASVPQGAVVAQQDNFLASSFHPEMAGEDRLHRYFVQMLENNF